MEREERGGGIEESTMPSHKTEKYVELTPGAGASDEFHFTFISDKKKCD
jgi:hypothetical protein